MDGTEGLIRGQVCTDIGSPIRIPVGPETLGRIINVIGEPIDERGPVNAKRLLHAAIHFLLLISSDFWYHAAVLSKNTVLHFGLILVARFQSYCVLAHLYLRNGQTECHHIMCSDGTDIVIMHGIIISILTDQNSSYCVLA